MARDHSAAPAADFAFGPGAAVCDPDHLLRADTLAEVEKLLQGCAAAVRFLVLDRLRPGAPKVSAIGAWLCAAVDQPPAIAYVLAVRNRAHHLQVMLHLNF